MEEAIKGGADILALLVFFRKLLLHTFDSTFILTKPSAAIRVSNAIMSKMSETETPQGIIGVIKMRWATLTHCYLRRVYCYY